MHQGVHRPTHRHAHTHARLQVKANLKCTDYGSPASWRVELPNISPKFVAHLAGTPVARVFPSVLGS